MSSTSSAVAVDSDAEGNRFVLSVDDDTPMSPDLREFLIDMVTVWTLYGGEPYDAWQRLIEIAREKRLLATNWRVVDSLWGDVPCSKCREPIRGHVIYKCLQCRRFNLCRLCVDSGALRKHAYSKRFATQHQVTCTIAVPTGEKRVHD